MRGFANKKSPLLNKTGTKTTLTDACVAEHFSSVAQGSSVVVPNVSAAPKTQGGIH